MTTAARLAALVMCVLSAACSRNPAATAPEPAQAPVAPPTTPAVPATTPATPGPAAIDLTGDWTWTIELGGQPIAGSMTLSRTGTTYNGTIIPDGMSPATLRTLTINGERVSMIVDTPDGAEAMIDATMAADRRSMSGTLAYQGQTGSFSARRR